MMQRTSGALDRALSSRRLNAGLSLARLSDAQARAAVATAPTLQAGVRAIGLGTSRPLFPPALVRGATSANTARLRAAVAAVRSRTRHAAIACVGPSTVAGQSTGAGGQQAPYSWPAQLARLLSVSGTPASEANLFCDHGSWGSAQTIANFLAGDMRVAATGSFALGPIQSLGGNLFSATAAGTLSFRPLRGVTRFDIWWRDSSTGNSFSASIDGAAPVTVASTGAFRLARTSVTTASSGAHTLTIGWIAGNARIVGVSAVDESGGRCELSVLNWGISGATSAAFVDNGDSAAGRLNAMAAVSPDAVLLADLPINDWRQGLDAAAAKENARTLVRAVRAYADPVLATPLWDSGTGGTSATQDAYAAGIADLAREEGVPLIDLRAALKSWSAMNTAGWASDSVHPTPLGYNAIAECYLDALRLLGG